MKRVLVCPVCASSDVELDTGGYTGKYHCKKCGYVGSFVVELEEDKYAELLKAGELEKFVRDRQKRETGQYDHR
jgi:transposase-like protein